jgi:hypothetical protein
MTEKINWHSPLSTFPISRKPSTPPQLVVKPYWAHPSIIITVNNAVSHDDNQWLYTGLSSASEQMINGLLFHYQTNAVQNEITAIRRVRLTEVNTPATNAPNNIIDDVTNLVSPPGGPAMYRKSFAPRKVNGALALQLQMVIGGNSSDFAFLGGIGIILQ